MRRRSAVAALLMTMGAVASAATPAAADWFSFTVKPRGEAAEAVRTGLAIYGLTRELKNRAKTRQQGTGNGAAISQNGSGNNAYVFQRGKGNSGSITQNGNNNAYGLFQFGRRNDTHVVQNGNGDVGFTVVGRW